MKNLSGISVLALTAAAMFIGTVFALAGCASQPRPVDDIAKVEFAIQQARNSNASMRAPLPLQEAEEKLEAARSAMAAEKYQEARMLADEAFADARLAEARSNSQEMQQIVNELERSVETLRDEINRLESGQNLQMREKQ